MLFSQKFKKSYFKAKFFMVKKICELSFHSKTVLLVLIHSFRLSEMTFNTFRSLRVLFKTAILLHCIKLLRYY